MKIGVLRETKTPPDRRVPFSPEQIAAFREKHGDVEFIVQPGPIRCFSNQEYRDAGIRMQEDLSDCDILFGVKEIEMDALMRGKACVFFLSQLVNLKSRSFGGVITTTGHFK